MGIKCQFFGCILFTAVTVYSSQDLTAASRELHQQIVDFRIIDFAREDPWEISIEKEDNPELISGFLDDGLSPNAKNFMGWSMLHMAVWNHRKGVVKTVLERGAKVDGIQGLPTPLYNLVVHFEASADEVEILGLLLDHGANPHLQVSKRGSPLEVARPVAKAILLFFERHKSRPF